jgi:cytochrome c553
MKLRSVSLALALASFALSLSLNTAHAQDVKPAPAASAPAAPTAPTAAAAPEAAASKAAMPAKAAAPAKPDLAKGSAISTAVCAACHNADGNSAIAANPKLAGQHPEYLVKQLMNFKSADGKPALRNNAVMAGFSAQLSDEDMRNLAAHYAKQTPKLGVAKATKEQLALGERIYRGGLSEKGLPACAGCHSPNGAGIPAQYPRLSGQWAEYTNSQLLAFREGGRKNSLQMSQIASKMTDKEMKAVADYIAGLR